MHRHFVGYLLIAFDFVVYVGSYNRLPGTINHSQS